jgi:preprotein translocase subunit SecY
MKLSKFNPIENKELYTINKTDKIQEGKKLNYAFLITIFLLTIIPLILFIGNIIYIEQIQMNIPSYYSSLQSDSFT